MNGDPRIDHKIGRRRAASVPGDAWNNPPARLPCGPPPVNPGVLVIDLSNQFAVDDLGKNNWALSTQRALSMLAFLTTKSRFVSKPMDRNLFSVAGYADTRPVDPARTEEARARNRRVEIVLLPPNTASLVEIALGEQAENRSPSRP
jgi:OmpA family